MACRGHARCKGAMNAHDRVSFGHFRCNCFNSILYCRVSAARHYIFSSAMLVAMKRIFARHFEGLLPLYSKIQKLHEYFASLRGQMHIRFECGCSAHHND
jgi:hypothetical protein